MTQSIRHFLLAIQFFTRIPVTGRLADWVGYSPAMLRASAAHLPGVGLLIGAAVAAFSWVLLQALPTTPHASLVVAVLGTVLSVWLTGGFHEDGLADVADGLGGSYERDRALEIMKDSRVGAFGAMALVLALASKVSLLALLGSLEAGVMALALVGGHVVSRLAPLCIIRTLKHVGDAAGSKSKPLADQISLHALAAAALWVLLTTALMALGASRVLGAEQGAWFEHLPGALGWGALGALLALLFMHRLLRRRLQGFTGDALGATQQVCEIAFYLGWAMGL